MQTGYYHLCSEGTRSDVLFHNREEFIGGMNLVAVVAQSVKVEILAFCLMDNHFHFILCCTEQQVELFAARVTQCYKVRRSVHFHDSPMEALKWSWFVIDSEEYLLSSIAYVLNNPVKAAYRCWFCEYPWSSGSLYFRDKMSLEVEMDSFRRVDSFCVRERRKLLASYVEFDGEWLITKWGFVWPGSYVQWKEVEKLYGSVRRFWYFLSPKREDEVEAAMMAKRQLGIPDVELREWAHSVCQALFGHNDLRALSVRERTEVARRLMVKLGCSEKQVLKVMRLKKE